MQISLNIIEYLQNLNRNKDKYKYNDIGIESYIAQVLIPKEEHYPSLLGDELPPLKLLLNIDSNNLSKLNLEDNDNFNYEPLYSP